MPARVYHKDYELPNPIEVRILPGSIEIISYSGVDPSLKQIDFDRGKVRSRRYRNRRIGEFLKELQLTEGRGTGIPTIKKVLDRNGSNPAIFDTDEPRRSYFFVEIPIHPDFISDTVDQDRDQVNTKITQVNTEITQVEEKITHVKNILGDEVKNRVSIRIIQTLEYCKEPKLRNEILENIGLSNESINFKNNIAPAINAGLITMLFPDKPKSRNQKYITTDKGKEIISKQL